MQLSDCIDINCNVNKKTPLFNILCYNHYYWNPELIEFLIYINRINIEVTNKDRDTFDHIFAFRKGYDNIIKLIRGSIYQLYLDTNVLFQNI